MLWHSPLPLPLCIRWLTMWVSRYVSVSAAMDVAWRSLTAAVWHWRFATWHSAKGGDQVDLHFVKYLLGSVHTCNVTAYRNTASWQCGRDSRPRKVSKVGYAVTLRAFSVCCRYSAVASKGWYGYGRSRCGRATWQCGRDSWPRNVS
jgi:hypothetical protein